MADLSWTWTDSIRVSVVCRSPADRNPDRCSRSKRDERRGDLTVAAGASERRDDGDRPFSTACPRPLEADDRAPPANRLHDHARVDPVAKGLDVADEADLKPLGVEGFERLDRHLERLGIEAAEALVDEQRLDAQALGAVPRERERQGERDKERLAAREGRERAPLGGVERVFDPADGDRDVYQAAYADYRGLYKRLKGLGAR